MKKLILSSFLCLLTACGNPPNTEYTSSNVTDVIIDEPDANSISCYNQDERLKKLVYNY